MYGYCRPFGKTCPTTSERRRR